MSGQLVGEVLAASDGLYQRGLSARGFHALIAIAEKADTASRQASVRWDHIRDGIYGRASKRTAERAVEDLKRLGIVRVVKSGFKNQHGVSRAPIYEIEPMVDADTQVSASNGVDHDTWMSASSELDTDKSEGGYRQIGVGYRHPGVVLDVFPDVYLDGARANTVEPEPPKHCPAHPRAQQKCPACKQATTNHKSWQQAVCPLCDSEGWLVGNDGTTLNVGKKCTAAGGHVLPAAVGRLCGQCTTPLDPRNPSTLCAECTFTENHVPA